MQQTCVNLASTNKNCAQLSIFGVNLSQFASTNKNTPFSHFGANLSQLQAQTLGTPNLSQSASVHMSSANAEAGEQT
jgi:hypothetical protein